MTLTKKKLDKLLTSMWILNVTKEQYGVILNRFGEEPGDGEVWSEEDICMQIKNIVSGSSPFPNQDGRRVFIIRRPYLWHLAPKSCAAGAAMAAVFAQSAPRRLTMLSCLLLIVAIIFYFMVLTSAQLFGRQMLNF
jgi:hypothetical protein